MELGFGKRLTSRLAEELFKDARTLCKTAGDRMAEYQANEYLVMISVERGRFGEAAERAGALKDLGERLRQGSEGPFARSLLALCVYALEDEQAPLEPSLEALRLVDAKHRLAYVLTHAALIDLERGRAQLAVERASEALEYAQVLERATEMMLARAILCCGQQQLNGPVDEHRIALAELEEAPVARWARQRARELVT